MAMFPGWEYRPRSGQMTASFFVLSFGAMAFWWWIATLATGGATCGGDGGEAHARPGSAAQWFCDGPLHSWLLAEGSLVVLAAAHLLAFSANRSTGQWRPARRWLVCAYVALALYSVPMFLPTS
jgi:hypothetical protein